MRDITPNLQTNQAIEHVINRLSGEELDPAILAQLTNRVIEGLTVYNNNLESATADLSRHLEGAQLYTINNGDTIIGFGIFRELDDEFVDLSFIVGTQYRSQGLGKKIIEVCSRNFPTHRYIVATTENVATYLAFVRQLGQENIISPIICGGQMLPILSEDFPLVLRAMALKGTASIDQFGYIEGYYGQTGLYATDVNQGSSFPLIGNEPHAVLIVARNPTHIDKI